MKHSKEPKLQPCPCGSGKSYKDCCQPYVEQVKNAPTAQALMRSRYSAFVVENEAYLRFSWHPDNCPKNIHINEKTQWLGLKIISTHDGKTGDETGEVEFVARNKVNGKASRLHELSRFIKHENRWVYLDAKPDQ